MADLNQIVFYVISNIQLSTRYLTLIVYKQQIFNLKIFYEYIDYY